MIIHTGGRTDTVKFFTDWLIARFEEGYVLSRNPMFPTHVSHLRLDPDVVDCVLFCSKDYAPILDRLHLIYDRFPTFYFYTITAYGADVEPNVPSIDESIATLYELERQVGAGRIAWRYDPVLLTSDYTIERHLETFESMAQRLAGHVDRCIFSFVEIDEMIRQNMPELLCLSQSQKEKLASGLGAIAAAHGIPLQICADEGDWTSFGVGRAGCISASMLEQANGIALKTVRPEKMRPHCRCMESRSLGDYNTCQGGCRYCHATRRRELVAGHAKAHDPASPMLIGHLKDSDQVTETVQRSYRTFQQSLF